MVRPISARSLTAPECVGVLSRLWMRAPANEALGLQKPLPNGMLQVVAGGERWTGSLLLHRPGLAIANGAAARRRGSCNDSSYETKELHLR